MKSFRTFLIETLVLVEGAVSQARSFLAGVEALGRTQRQHDAGYGSVGTFIPISGSVSRTTTDRLELPPVSSVPGYIRSRIADPTQHGMGHDTGGWYSNAPAPPADPYNAPVPHMGFINTKAEFDRATAAHEIRHAIQYAGLGINRGLRRLAQLGDTGRTPGETRRLGEYRRDPSTETVQNIVAPMDLRPSTGDLPRRQAPGSRGGEHVPITPGNPTDKGYTEFISAITGVPYHSGSEELDNLMRMPSQHREPTDSISYTIPTYALHPWEHDARVQNGIDGILRRIGVIEDEFKSDETAHTHVQKFLGTGDTTHLDALRQHVRNTVIQAGSTDTYLDHYHKTGNQYLDELEQQIRTGDMAARVREYGSGAVHRGTNSGGRYATTPEWEHSMHPDVWKKTALAALARFRDLNNQTVAKKKREMMGAAGLILDNSPRVDSLVASLVGRNNPSSHHTDKLTGWLTARQDSYDPEFNIAAAIRRGTESS